MSALVLKAESPAELDTDGRVYIRHGSPVYHAKADCRPDLTEVCKYGSADDASQRFYVCCWVDGAPRWLWLVGERTPKRPCCRCGARPHE